MSKYKTLLFDVDDTLLDFGAAEDKALAKLFQAEQIPFTKEIELSYKKLNKGLWVEFEEGKLDRDELVNTRFTRLFQQYNREVDGVMMEKNYRRYLEEGDDLVEGAMELISSLSKDYELYIVTNGVSKTQDKRLRSSGLYPYFKDIFVSEATGYQKPMKEYFKYVFDRIPNFDLAESLIIGDTLGSDIKGGANVGLATCWFNPEDKANFTNIVPTYQIQKLNQLYPILAN